MKTFPMLPRLGAAIVPGQGVEFRVWAPDARLVEVVLDGAADAGPLPLRRHSDGYHTTLVPDAGAGERYRYLVDGAGPFPDPCSRSQPDGPHGPSQVVAPLSFPWTDAGWSGPDPDQLVVYELHIGAFTAEGTFDAAIGELGRLRDLGVTVIELMPVAEFPGVRGWGYDGVNLFAPHHAYGGPDGLRRLVDAAHRLGLAVILDVVYNHLGPDGNYLRAFSPFYFTDRHSTPWGEALNYEGPHSRPVRDFVCANVEHWITEYHLDGLRLDAVHAIYDDSPVHILEELTARARNAAAPRQVVIIAESHANDVRLIRPPAGDGSGAEPQRGGIGLDGVWADDFHHVLHVHLTGERDGYYGAYAGTTEEMAATINGGFLFQGQVSPHSGRPRGTVVTDEPGRAFVFCLQNHDQAGNRAEGERLATLADRDRATAAAALLLLIPETPMLFMGEEYGATSPFLFFTDHHDELGRLVTDGRRQEFAGFPAFQDAERRARIPDPQAETTFLRSKLDRDERARNAGIERLHRDLLALRRDDPVLRIPDRLATRATAPNPEVVAVHRWNDAADRLLLINFGAEADVDWRSIDNQASTAPEWRILWRSNAPEYGSSGPRPALNQERISLPARCAVLLTAGR